MGFSSVPYTIGSGLEVEMEGTSMAESFWDQEELLGKFVKNSREEIHIKRVSKNTRSYIDIRTFWFDSNNDEFRPSQKGVAIPVEFVGELKSILEGVE